MGPLTCKAYAQMQNAQMRADTESAAHILIPFEMWWRVRDIALSLPDDSMWEGLLPAPSTVVEVEGRFSILAARFGDEVAVTHLAGQENEEAIATNTLMSIYSPRSYSIRFGKALGPTENGLNSGHGAAINTAAVMDILFTLMAEPRFVEQTPVSRIRRGMAAKRIGVPALRHTWVKVGWTIGGTTRAKGNLPGSAPQKAFHMVRAHWRKYDRKTPKAERRAHRHGWWVWIESHYSGNPALGEIKHQYHPKLEDPGKSSKLVHEIVAARIAQTLNPHLADA